MPALAPNPKLGRERQIRSVRTGLIPTLSSGSDRTEDDRIPKHERSGPNMILFILKLCDLLGQEIGVVVEIFWVTSDETGSAEEIAVFFKSAIDGESLGIDHDLFFAETLRHTINEKPWRD